MEKTPVDRLRRDLLALGPLTEDDRPPASERLADRLDRDLLAAVLDELARCDPCGVPLDGRPRRAA
jgi:hypothetical protein